MGLGMATLYDNQFFKAVELAVLNPSKPENLIIILHVRQTIPIPTTMPAHHTALCTTV